MKKQYPVLVLAAVFTLLGACKKSNNPPEGTPFTITDYYVGGTISPKSNQYTSVFLISLLENNKAVFIGSGNNLTGDYRLTNDSLVVTISDPNNYRVARFALNSKREITSAYYKALTTEYNATGNLLKIGQANQFSGKSFKGEEFKMGPSSFRKDLVYKFNTAGTAYGSGTDAATIDANANSFELIHNSAFKFKSGSNVEMGFTAANKLTVFRSSGLFYYGTYTQQ